MDDSVAMLTPHHHNLPTFHNLNPHYSLALPSPSSSHSLSHSHSHSHSHGFSPYTSPRHAHITSSVFDSSNSSSHGSSMASHDLGDLSSSSPSGLASSSALSTSASSSLPVVDDTLYNYVASAASLEGMSAEDMLRNPNVMLAVRQAMALNLTQSQSAYMPPPQPHLAQPLHHPHSLMARSLPGSPLPLTMPTPPPPSFHSLAAEGCGNFVPSSPVAGPTRSPSLLGSGRSKRLRLDESEQRALGGGNHVPSPAPLAVLSEDSSHNPHAPSSVSNCPPPTVAHLNAMLAQSLPFGAPMMPMMAPLPPMLHNRSVEHSMLMDCQSTQSPTAASAASSSSSHAVSDPALLLMRQHHQQQQLLNFNHLLTMHRGLGGFGTTMATPISSSSTLPTISAVALSSPSSVFASQRSVTSVSPAPSLSSVSSASSPSLATPTKSCFSRTSSSASSTPRTDDSSLDSFHSSRFSQTDDSELHLPDCDKPFACNDCHKRFSNESRLANHRRTHNNSRPYECVACNKQFNHKGSLTRHMRTHSGDKPHVCDQCGKRFFQPGNLTVHIRTHTGERPFECERCGKRFNHRSSLTVHQRSHM